MLHRRKNVSLHRENYFSMNGGYIQYTTPLSDKDIVLCVHPMLYASPLITLTQHGYTKHYFEEGRRICSKIGGGFINVHPNEINNHVQELNHNTYEWQYQSQLNGIRYTFGHCIHSGPNVIPTESLRRMLFEQELSQDRGEPAFYYHSDHLGSTAYLVVNGHVAQVLNYLPFGEDWLESNNFNPDDTTRLGIYRFNGKEKDWESGFHYFGARYYWSEVLTGWLSVDPMADKYPSISPYAYCAWNPIKLVDPDGRRWKNSSDSSAANDMRDNVQLRINDIESSIRSCQQAREKRIAKGRSVKNQDDELSELENQKKLLTDFLDGLYQLEQSKITFTFCPIPSDFPINSGFMPPDEVYSIKYQINNEGNMLHKTKHAIQIYRADYLDGEIMTWGEMETDAYSTQYSFNPNSILKLYNDSGITPSSRIPLEWVRGLYFIKNAKREYPYGKIK